MLLSDVFVPEFIKCNLESLKKESVFEELVDHFCQASGLDIRSDVLAALRAREVKMSTGIQKGIAIPHGKTTAVKRVHGVLGISKKGIEYDSLDGNPVYLVLMILAPPVEAEQHLHLLQRMAELLRNPDFYRDVTAQNDVDAVYAVLKKYEEQTSAIKL